MNPIHLLLGLLLSAVSTQTLIAQDDPFRSQSTVVIPIQPGFNIDNTVLSSERLMSVLLKRHEIPEGGWMSGAVVELAQKELSKAQINNVIKGEPGKSADRKVIQCHGKDLSLLEMLALMSSKLHIVCKPGPAGTVLSITYLPEQTFELVLINAE